MSGKDSGKTLSSSSVANETATDFNTSPVNERMRTQDANTDEISLKEIFVKFGQWRVYLLSKWHIILVAAILGGIIGYVYSWSKKPLYTAITTFVLESGDGAAAGMGQYAGLASMVGIDLGGGGGGIFQGDNIIELYKSRTMIEKSLLSRIEYKGKKQLLIDRYIDFNQLREGWAKSAELKNFEFKPSASKPDRLQDSIIGTIVTDINQNYLTVEKPDKQLSIIMVEVKAKDEFFAKVFNEQIVKNVNDFYVQTKTKKSLENVQIIQQKTDSVRRVMNGAIYSAATIADATPNLNPTRQVQRVAPQQRSQFTVETNKAILSELVKNLEMSKISVLKETPLIQIIDKPVFPLQMQTFSKVKGFALGLVLFAFLTVAILTVQLLFKKLMNN